MRRHRDRSDASHSQLSRQNVELARSRRGLMGDTLVRQLKALTKNYGFSLSLGDLIYSQNGWYVSHAGLLRLSSRKGCAGIHVEQMVDVSDPSIGRWVFRATVFTKESSRGFVGYGDADPSNVSQQVRGAEMRVAETRAVNRALRKAYGIGLCSVEELGSPIDPLSYPNATPENKSENHSNNGQPRLRDKLSLLIRHYRLDANLVKVYAADFCGTQNLGSASRDLVESFINQLEKSARENRDGLVCKLNSYMPISGVTR